MSIFAERAIERLAPWNTGPVIDGRTDLERYLRALAAMFEPVEALAAEVGEDGTAGYTPAWGTLLDVDTAPADALPYLAMYVGVILPTGVSEAEARELIKIHTGFSRGTRASIEAAIERSLTGSKAYDLIERTEPSGEEAAYWFLVVVEESQLTPEGDPAALEKAIRAVKPAGLLFEVIQTDEAIWDEATLAWDEVGAGVIWSTVTKAQIT